MEATRTCSIPDCDQPAKARVLCGKHWHQWRKTAVAGEVAGYVRADACQVPNCDRPHLSKGYCARHYRKFQLYGDPLHSEPRGAAKTPMIGAANRSWKGNAVGYRSAHNRVERTRGQAALHLCSHCGNQAAQWAYGHADPDVLTDDRGYLYSADPAHYLPLCLACHTALDMAHGKRRR